MPLKKKELDPEGPISSRTRTKTARKSEYDGNHIAKQKSKENSKGENIGSQTREQNSKPKKSAKDNTLEQGIWQGVHSVRAWSHHTRIAREDTFQEGDSGIERISIRLALREVKHGDPTKLMDIFGKRVVTVDDCFKEIHALICKKKSLELKALLELDIFDLDKYWYLREQLEDDHYKPVVKACSNPSFECLKVLLQVEGVLHDSDRCGKMCIDALFAWFFSMN